MRFRLSVGMKEIPEITLEKFRGSVKLGESVCYTVYACIV